MKKHIFLLLLILISINISAQESKVFENGLIKSSILNEEMKFSIYLPAGYELSERDYPVVYLLHGLTDDNTAWIQFGEMQRIVDQGINEDKITPMIIVMPDAKLTYYMNDVNGNYKYEDYFFRELIPYIEKNYRCRSGKEFRGIAGLSMGGFGSLLYALKHPDMFAACSALSAAVRTDEEIINMPGEDYSKRFGALMGGVKEGAARITEYYNENSILYLVKNLPENQKTAVKFYIDCGDNDSFYKGNDALHTLMRDLNIPHEFRVRDGNHEWEYWREGLIDALNFISQSFNR